VGNTEGNSGEFREPVIVVSDVHLGGASSDYKAFWDFLGWLNTLSDNGTSVDCNGNNIDIKKPGTIVLLGDILELWDPRKDDRDYVIKDVLTPISILNDIDCDIIYVIGNHDEDLHDIKKVLNDKGLKFPYKGKGTFRMYYRTYPEKNKDTKRVDGVEIGKERYAFLHGHQFDKLQICHKISNFLGFRFDPIDWLQDLANVSYTKKIRMKLGRATGIFTLLLILLYGVAYYLLFFRIPETKVIPVGDFYGVLWVFISFLFLVTVLPVCLTFWFTKIWDRIGIKCKPIEEVIKKRYNAKKGGKIDADIIVFGHTHNAGYYPKEPKKDERLFINTGCWVDISEKKCIEKKAIPNTFLYIDTRALYLLKWNKEVKEEEKKITCVKDFREVLSQ